MTEETIVAVYDTAAHADAAVRDLHAANVPAGAISVHAGATETVSGSSAAPAREPGFWSNLFGGQPDHDTAVYDHSMSSGSTVVTVKAPVEHIDAVSRILESHNPIDMEERSASYGVAAPTTTTPTSQAAVGVAPVAASGKLAGGEEVIALSEEQIAVGKHLVNRGTTRVRRFVVETPVEEQVRLHSERVSIERRPVTAGAQVPDSAFKDRVIEVAETDEEAVVGKTTHVAEEVVVRKDVTDRVETIHDTVRREDVEVVKDAGVQTAGATQPVRPKI